MPTMCRITFPRLTEDEMRAVDYRVMAHAFATHNELGRLCDESVYESTFATRLSDARFGVSVQEPITLTFRDFSTTLFFDLVVDERVPYELKAVAQLLTEHEDQLLGYLLATNARRGKLVNFRSESVESRFVNAPLDADERRRFHIDTTRWSGESSFPLMVTELVRDWGTSLGHSLYTQALVACLGGKDQVIRQLPMELEARPLGNQRFLLASEDAAFRITTFPTGAPQDYGKQLRKLLRPSPLKRFYWANVGRHRLDFVTIVREE